MGHIKKIKMKHNTVVEVCQSGWRTRSEMVGELGIVWQQGKNGWETRPERLEN